MATAQLSRGDALLIVDVQNDFCPGGALPIPEGDRVVPVLNDWIEAAFRATPRHSFLPDVPFERVYSDVAIPTREANGVPIYVLKTNTILQMENMLASLFDLEADPQEAALRETAEAIGLVQASGNPVELAPQNAYVRRLQHQMAEKNALMSRSRGSEPNRRVELIPEEGRTWR